MKQIYVIIVLLLYSCTNKVNGSFDIFTREDVPISTPEKKIIYDYSESEKDFNLERILIYNDSIWVKQYLFNPRSRNIIEFVNSNDSTQTKGFITYGKGHMEMKGGSAFLNDNYLAVNDVEGTKTIALFDMDSVFRDGYKPEMVKNVMLISQTHVLRNKDILIGNYYFFEYLSAKQHFNVGSERIVKLKRDENYQHKYVNGKDFIVNYGDILITANEQKNRIVSASRKLPEITFMDTLFNIKRVLVGPDKFDISFSDNAGDIYSDKISYAYSSLCKTDNYIYLVYEGFIDEDRMNWAGDKNAPSEVIKIDWDGNVKHIYKLDKIIYYPYVKNDEELVGTIYIDGELHLVQYDISNK